MIIILCVAAIVVIVLLLFLVRHLRFRVKMAALIAWIVGSLTGAGNNAEEQSTAKIDNVKSQNSKSAPKDANNSRRNKVYKEPIFNTNLTIPIEDVIKESTQEEKSIRNISSDINKSKGVRKKQKEGTKSSKSLDKQEVATPEILDDVGFSFFPVKSKGRTSKKSHEGKSPLDNTKVTKASLEQVQNKQKSKSPNAQKKDFLKNTELISSKTEIVKSNFNPAVKISDCKPSKKVNSSVSYASVVLNNFSEDNSDSLSDLPVKHNSKDINIATEIEVRKESYSENITEESTSNSPYILCHINQEGTTVHSKTESSSSIEVINENCEIGIAKEDTALKHTVHNNSEEVDELPHFNSVSKYLESITDQRACTEHTIFAENNIIESQPYLNNTCLTQNIFESNIEDHHIDDDLNEQQILEESVNYTHSPAESIELISEDIQKQIEHFYDEYMNDDRTIKLPYFPDSLSQQVQLQNKKETIYSCELLTENIDESIVDNQVLNSISLSEKSTKAETTSDMMTQIRILTLNDKEHHESTLYRLQKDWVIQFRLGPSLLGRKVNLLCNYPEDGSNFFRNQYTLLKWSQDEGCKNADDTALYTQITLNVSGSFHYYITYEDEEERRGSGYILVDPVLKYGSNEELPLDCIQCQTILAKGLGPFSTWENKLKVSKESGYNMIHFTPIQKLGISNSSYSLSEQLQLNPLFNSENGIKVTFDNIQELISKLRREWKVTSICDIVLNHTASESEWLKEHPETTYNCKTCPYMRPAYLLDAALYQFSLQVKKGLFEDRGIPEEVATEDHLSAIRYHFKNSILEPLNIPELYMADTDKYLNEFLSLARKAPPSESFNTANQELKLLQDPEYRRLGSKIDINLAIKLYNVYRNDCFEEETRIKRCAEDFKAKIDSLNAVISKKIDEHLNAAIENVIAGIRYFRVQADGPKIREICEKNPLVHRYFTDFGAPQSIEEHEEIMYSENGAFLMAHNGWVMDSDPLRNFAAPDSNVYIRRELIAWSDSVKLRYGDKPEDCPFLWRHMKEYVQLTAKIFDGVRLDNCHSTPIPVAEYLLDCARQVRPDLYVVAELFTNSDITDNIFVNRLGITSLIREAMSAWDSHEEGRLVYRYGGYPVGSFYQPSIRPLTPSIAHALFLDLTHDNPSPVEKRSVFDLLPTTALVNMACCASGSNRGYDELVPHHIHVVDETREYTEWSRDENLPQGNIQYVTSKSGIIQAKKVLNDLHYKLGKEGFDQVYVDQIDADIVAVTRHCPKTHQSYILVAFTAFQHPDENDQRYQRGIKPLRVEGVLNEVILESTLTHTDFKTKGIRFMKFSNFAQDDKWINGLTEYKVEIKQHIQVNESDMLEEVDSGTPGVIQLNFKSFKPGSVVVIKVSLPEELKDSVNTVHKLMDKFSKKKDSELTQIVNKMTLADLNRAVYRCDQEEKDEGFGFDTYNIPNFGPTVYAGIQGITSVLANIRSNNDLGHPFCANLRDGNWMIEYVWKRLKLDEGTKELGQWLEENTRCFRNIPRYLVPCYFDLVITGVYVILVERCYQLMSDFIRNGSTFVRGLALGSVQLAAYIKSADLPTLSPNLAPPKPPVRKNNNGELVQACVTLSAGLPHFSTGYTRNWGRDTFIALRGLFILTGRFEEARQHILGYAACLRHGLIPNLLDGGRNSRYNCRDAVWWWLHCIKEYVEECPNGSDILQDQVSRIFPTDDSPAEKPGVFDQPLCEVMQESLKVHFQGLAFRERNAGRQIDEHMTDRGFNNQIGIHPDTGFVFGGNEWNCGTWMDKMGSSDKAGNRGKPATPRDGSAIELIGLSKAVVSWLWELSQENKYPHDGVERVHKNGSVTKWTFKEWGDKIQANFEKFFWVNTVPIAGEVQSDLVNKRGIYKDTYGASRPWTDYQLRCNFPIAMVVAPELFNPQHAWAALKQAEKYLVGPLGMKTLDPEDWSYRGDYDNSNDSGDPSIACGFNYHQGPEWVWPVGFYLRAKLIFASQNGAFKETLANTKLSLSKHFTELQTSPWRGLPELTNSNGSYCRDSSRTQAWSMSCILEVLYDLQKLEAKSINVN